VVANETDEVGITYGAEVLVVTAATELFA